MHSLHQVHNGTVNYTEINDKGFLVVTGSATASFFGNVTTIIGDTDCTTY